MAKVIVKGIYAGPEGAASEREVFECSKKLAKQLKAGGHASVVGAGASKRETTKVNNPDGGRKKAKVKAKADADAKAKADADAKAKADADAKAKADADAKAKADADAKAKAKVGASSGSGPRTNAP